MSVQQLRRRVTRLEQRHGVDQTKLVIKGALFGPPAWRDADGFGLCFVGTWTAEEKAEALRVHLGVGFAAACQLAKLEETSY
jgi:hypothetical protein